MAIRNVITRGFGAGASIPFVVTAGFSIGSTVAIDAPGIGYKSPGRPLHYVSGGERFHYRSPGRPFSYEAES